MIYSDSEYPYGSNDVPALEDVLDAVNWDVLCVFSGARVDSFEEHCGSCSPVESPAISTEEWVREVWCDPVPDWSDVTYVSGDPRTSQVRTEEGEPVHLEDHVGEYIKAWEIDEKPFPWSEYMDASKPRELSAYARQLETPIVVHYMQPDPPFMDDILYRVDGCEETTVNSPVPEEYQMVQNGLVDADYARLAYMMNLQLVWESTIHTRDRYDCVLTTSVSGRLLGPDRWGVDPDSPQSRVVPFHACGSPSALRDFPDAGSLGAGESYSWGENVREAKE